MSSTLEARIGDHARRLGFELVGICRPQPSARDTAAYRAWVEAGMAGEMGYMARPDRVEKACRPTATLTEVRSLVVVGKRYFAGDLPPAVRGDPSRGLIASYAWRRDYHDVMVPRLEALAAWLRDALGRETAVRAYVDYGPVLERDAAVRAGLGFVGRNTMLIHPEWGAWLFLGELLLDIELTPSDEPSGGTCGRCTRCIEACPTDAFPQPYVLDARRCISYLTIELKGPIPRHLRAAIGNRIFGCDICNEVCPYNQQLARHDPVSAPLPIDHVAPRLLDLVTLDDDAFRARYRGTPIARPKRRGFLRNVCVALGNWGASVAVPGLTAAMRDHEPLVRGHAAWALGRMATPAARRALSAARRRETDGWVSEEIELALAAASA